MARLGFFPLTPMPRSGIEPTLALLHLFEGPYFRTLFRLSYSGPNFINLEVANLVGHDVARPLHRGHHRSGQSRKLATDDPELRVFGRRLHQDVVGALVVDLFDEAAVEPEEVRLGLVIDLFRQNGDPLHGLVGARHFQPQPH